VPCSLAADVGLRCIDTIEAGSCRRPLTLDNAERKKATLRLLKGCMYARVNSIVSLELYRGFFIFTS